MSLVGTRPILQEELRQYELHHRARIAIKPGITGMWQVSGRSDITDFEEVVRLDTEYISKYLDKQSALDKKICKEEKLQVIFNGVDIKAYENGTHRCALTDSIWGGVNRVLSYYCLFYLGAVVRELQKTVRIEKYHYWKMVVAFLILVLCNQIGSIALDENRYENPAFLLVVSICGWVLLYEIAQEVLHGRLCAE